MHKIDETFAIILSFFTVILGAVSSNVVATFFTVLSSVVVIVFYLTKIWDWIEGRINKFHIRKKKKHNEGGHDAV